MSLRSMTGFSSTILSLTPAHKGKEIQLTMTLKSLNSRFFEVNCKLPYSLNQLEIDITKILKAKLYRGNIYFSIYMHSVGALTATIEPSLDSITEYAKALEAIKQKLSLHDQITLKDIINLPGIFETNERPITEDIRQSILEAVEQLADNLNRAREKEGSMLAQDLIERIKCIKIYLGELEPRAEVAMNSKKKQLFDNLKTLLPEGSNENPSDLQCLSLYNQLDKIDIHEEIIRFKTHLDNLEFNIQSKDNEKGKKLDFILQELFREINTITSKCSDACISSLGINIKVELEKSREQVQNIV